MRQIFKEGKKAGLAFAWPDMPVLACPFSPCESYAQEDA